jgi:glutaredoxin-like protein
MKCKQEITMPKLLNEQVTQQVQKLFAEQLKEPVAVLFFGSQKTACDYCDDTRQLIEEVTALSPKLHLSQYDLDEHADLARQYGMDKVPGLVLAGRDGDQITDYGIRLAGIPAGHEFTTLIHDLILVSGRDSGLSAKTRQFLSGLTKPVHLQVFVTPT